MQLRFSHKLLPYVSQKKYPRLWYIFQLFLGGTFDKRQLAIKFHQTEKRILEIGCSSGNISTAFKNLPGIEYLGIDIDQSAIELANKIHKKQNSLSFQFCDLESLTKKSTRQFDYILFGGVLHHVSNDEAGNLIRLAKLILSDEGKIVIYEPLPPRENDKFLIKFVHNVLEQGRYVRAEKEYRNFIGAINGLELVETEELFITAFLFKWPKIARFLLLVCELNQPK